MEYRVEELARRAATRVDTLRFYQGRGLLPPPRREGRVAWYGEAHLARLKQIRALQDQGFSLAQIRRVLDEQREQRDGRPEDALLSALVKEQRGERTLSAEELAAETGVPTVMLRAAIRAGLVEPLQVDGEERFSQADAEMARAGLALLAAGFPLPRLLEQAVGHARHVNQLCDAAIELFDESVRKQGPSAGDMEGITEVFRTLLPQVTRLVALHFQRTLVTRALNRLEGREELEALEAALAATRSARLEVEVGWR